MTLDESLDRQAAREFIANAVLTLYGSGECHRIGEAYRKVAEQLFISPRKVSKLYNEWRKDPIARQRRMDAALDRAHGIAPSKFN